MVMTVTWQQIMTNYKCEIMISSTQEEKDSLRAIEVARNGMNVHTYSQETNVLLLVQRINSLFGEYSALIIGTSERRCKVILKPIYDKNGQETSAALSTGVLSQAAI